MKFLTILADESTSLLESLTTDQPKYNYLGEFVNMLLTLTLVIGLIVFTVWMMKRFMQAKWRPLGQYTNIRVIERRALSPKSSLYLVDILGKGVVIADTPAGVTLVKEFSDEVDLEELIQKRFEEQQEEPLPSLKERFTQKFKVGFSRRA